MTYTLPASTQRAEDDIDVVFTSWLASFTQALESGDATKLAPLLADDVTWRDFMAFPWDFHHTIGQEETASRLTEYTRGWHAAGFQPHGEQGPFESAGMVNGFFDFTTLHRNDRGYVRLVPSARGWVASVLQTQVVGLQDFPERSGHLRPEGKVYGIVPGRTRWADDRAREARFDDEDPAVLVLGAGHNGLALAARLSALDVPTLVIDKEARIGDTWRKRYAALALHSSVHGDHLPYISLPPTWPAHVPKDKVADWLESYATLLDLNVWTSTTFLSGFYDEVTQRWTIRLRRGNGTIQILHPRHFIVAGGLFGSPKIPEIPGLEDFTGLAVHSDLFQDAASFTGKRALVIGAGVSGHELAHDLWEQGAETTMVQRSSTYVVTYDTYHKHWASLFHEDMPLTPDLADQITYALPNERSDEINKELVQLAKEDDRELLEKLESAGFKLNWGINGTGILGNHMSGKDSYQIDIGASQLVADGRIRLKQGVEVTEIRDGKTVVFSDGSELEDVDLIVFATGYHQFWGHIKPALGKMADKIDKAYGRAADGEYANTWRRSSQPGLWFATGFIRMARFYTPFTTLLIKAIEEGLEPIDPARPLDDAD
ncbi:NAD(P)-binding domain-containing protein [Microbacterium sp. NPDC055357]